MIPINSNNENMLLFLLAEIHNRLAAIAGHETNMAQPMFETVFEPNGSLTMRLEWKK